ncbi:crotonase/enoyl-CoA hydratase family protein [Zavarzinia aquatilis]|uniref:Enoyl-CoA hydratase n=1 Tax=Zavarzinia aquatilis TaxID=2211142 RepID=A0A317EBP1_9PROT|nr:crotonase/enoyl-CoA hydratase family protein [Zavarzinia aquatilis]PWR24151.1 enoyl-CoA hydratase [Zavarzinia aquatilis]
MSDNGRIVTSVEGHILKIGISRPEKKNSFTPEMMAGLAEALDRLENDPELRVGIVHGDAGNFTAGLDLMKFVPIMAGEQPAPVFSGIDPLQLKARCTKPLVAAVSGLVFTVGIEIMLACDIVIAGDDCMFTQVEVARGIMVSGGGTVRWLQNAGWGNAMQYLLTGDKFDAATAYRIGIVQKVVPAAEVMASALDVASRIAANAPLAVRETKRSSLRYLQTGEAAAFDALDATQAQLAKSADALEGAMAMMQKRPPAFTGQ